MKALKVAAILLACAGAAGAAGVTAAPAAAQNTVPPEVEALLRDSPPAIGAHVGSYRMPGNAPADWHRLADFWPGVLYFKRLTKVVDIPGKGTFTRLYLVGDPAMAPVLCRSLTQRGKYCRLHDLETGTELPVPPQGAGSGLK